METYRALIQQKRTIMLTQLQKQFDAYGVHVNIVNTIYKSDGVNGYIVDSTRIYTVKAILHNMTSSPLREDINEAGRKYRAQPRMIVLYTDALTFSINDYFTYEGQTFFIKNITKDELNMHYTIALTREQPVTPYV